MGRFKLKDRLVKFLTARKDLSRTESPGLSQLTDKQQLPAPHTLYRSEVDRAVGNGHVFDSPLKPSRDGTPVASPARPLQRDPRAPATPVRSGKENTPLTLHNSSKESTTPPTARSAASQAAAAPSEAPAPDGPPAAARHAAPAEAGLAPAPAPALPSLGAPPAEGSRSAAVAVFGAEAPDAAASAATAPLTWQPSGTAAPAHRLQHASNGTQDAGRRESAAAAAPPAAAAAQAVTSGEGRVAAALASGDARLMSEDRTKSGSASAKPGEQLDVAMLVEELQSGSIEARSAAAERLFNRAAEDEAARMSLAAAARDMPATQGVIKPLVQLLYDGRERGRMYAAYALSSIMTPNDSAADVCKAGAIPALISVLNTSKVLASKKGAMRALGRLARNDEAAAQIVTAGGLPPIVSLLDSEDSSLVRRCLIALYFVGADKEALQEEIMRAGGVPATVRLCKSMQAEVQAEAADVLKVLARNPRCASVVVDAGGLEVLGWVAGSGGSERARTSATKAIQRLGAQPALEPLVQRSPAGQYLVTQSSSDHSELAELAAVFTRGAPAERQQAAMAIVDVAAEDPSLSRDLASAGVVEPLVKMLKGGDDKGQIHAARALANMAADAVVRERIFMAGAVPHLVAVLKGDGAPAAAAAVALGRLASHRGSALVMVREQAAVPLVAALDSPQQDASAGAVRALFLLSGVDQGAVVPQIRQHGGMALLLRKCIRGSPDVRAVALAIVRDMARIPACQPDILAAGGVSTLLVLWHSPLADVRELATSALDLLAATPHIKVAISSERDLQSRISALVAALRQVVAVSPALEEALRLIPRSAFLPGPLLASEAYTNMPLEVAGTGVVLGSPQGEALAASALGLAEGHAFLDAGSGAGYLTALAAHLVGSSGRAVGVEVRQSAVQYAEGRLAYLRQARGLSALRASFVCANVLDAAQQAALGQFDRIYVGANCPRSRLRDLLRLLRPGGKLAVPCEGQLLLLVQPVEGPVAEPINLGAVAVSESLLPEAAPPAPLLPSPPSPPDVPLLDSRASSTGANGITKLTHSPLRGAPPAAAAVNGSIEGKAVGHSTDTGGASSVAAFSPSRRPGGPNIAWAPPPREHSSSVDGPVGSSRRSANGNTHSVRSGASNSREADDEFPVEEEHGWFISRDDIRICRNAEGKKCRLGEGGFGVVYKALMNGVDEVAVKLVKADKPSMKELTLFHKEVRVLRKLHHRNIVQFYGASLEPGAMFFVTELMKGGDLYSALRNHAETMRWERLGRKVALDVALGINYLHTRRPPLCHRDLKSPNVLLSEEGVAKIADVGMVRSQVKELVTAQPVMTPLWAAPEVIRHERASIKADIWSYGILIWELVSGLDITEFQPLAIARQMQGQHSGKTLALPAACPGIAARIFVECTKMEPEARPSAQQIVEWLRAVN